MVGIVGFPTLELLSSSKVEDPVHPSQPDTNSKTKFMQPNNLDYHKSAIK